MTTVPAALRNIGSGDLERLRDFLQLGLPEGPTLEYKRDPARSLVRAVAGMANTDGGVVIVGVTEDAKTKTPVDEGGVELADIRGTVENLLWRYLEPVPKHDLVVIPADAGRVYGVLFVEQSSTRTVLDSEAGVLVRHGDMSVAPNRADFERLLAREAQRRDRARELTDRRAGAAGLEAEPGSVESKVTAFAFVDAVDPAAIWLTPVLDAAFTSVVSARFRPFEELVTGPHQTIYKENGIDFFRLSDTGDFFGRISVNRSGAGRDWPPEGVDAVRAIDLATDLVALQLLPFELAKRDSAFARPPYLVTVGIGGYAGKALVTNVRHEPRLSQAAPPPRIVRSSVVEHPRDAVVVACRAITDLGRALQVSGTYDWTEGLASRVVLNADGKLDEWKEDLVAAVEGPPRS